MSKIVSILKSGWFIGLIGTLFLILLVWFLGPLIGIGSARPLEGIAARLLTSLLFLVIWAGFVVWGMLRRRKRQSELVDGVTNNAAAGGDAGPEVEALRKNLERALSELQRMRRKDGKSGRQYLYELPWYMIIGPPGSGKTTALLNSGLGFPLGNDPQQAKISGAGGTRNCDWWFTDEAVLLDTAGRYTTQDSDASTDAAAWQGFLDILRKARPRQPINGLIVAISISDIMTESEQDRRAHALSIRKRISELYDRLGLRLPVYVVLTKTDLVAGFMEFFGDMRRDDRAQVWGTTYPFLDLKNDDSTDPLDLFPEEFNLLLERLEQGRLDRLHQEDDFARAGLIAGFPLQVAALRDPIMQVLEEAFRAGRYEEPVLLRGVYFTSGTQEGTPIDRVMAGLAGRFGVPPARFGAFRGQGRSYFLTRLLREVLFTEAGMVGRNRAVERRQRLIRGGAIALASLVLLTSVGLWTWSTLVNRDLIARTKAGIETYTSQVAEVMPADGSGSLLVKSADLPPILPALATIRDLPLGYRERNLPAPMGSGFGLYQGDKLAQQAATAYTSALNGLLLPRLTYRLRGMLSETSETTETEVLYSLLKMYLMVGGQGPVDPALLRQWAHLDVARRYPGTRNEPMRAEVDGHVAALTGAQMRTMPIDGPLVVRTREILQRQPLAERAYALIRNSRDAKALPQWRVTTAAGPAARRAFVRRSGADLDEGIDGFYTYDGFHKVFLPSLVDVSREVASESWVLGENATLDDAQIRLLERDLAALYMDDYVAQWDGMLSDIALRPFQTASDATDVLGLLSGANSPLRNLLHEAAEQTRLARPEEEGGVGGALASLGAGGSAASQAQSVEQVAGEARNVGQTLGLGTGGISVVERLAGIFSDSSLVGGGGAGTGGASERALPGQFVNDRFRQLHQYVLGLDGGTAPLEDMIRQLGDAYNEIRRVANNGGGLSAAIGTGGGGGVDAVRRLGTEAAQVPAPLNGWLDQIASGGQSIAVSSTQQSLDTAWSGDVLPLCQQALHNRYPIVTGSSNEVAMADFARLFAPNGLIDGFFRQNLLPYVDMGRKPWQSRRYNGIDLGLSRGTLAQFERAATIRDAFFPTGGGQLSVPFEVTPVSLDASANSVVLEIDGQQVNYAHGPVLPARLTWPGPGGQTRVSFQSNAPGLPTISGGTGPWAFFRLLDQGRRLDGGTGDRFRIQFSVSGMSAIFEIRAGSVTNPFNLRELKSFRCPGNL